MAYLNNIKDHTGNTLMVPHVLPENAIRTPDRHLGLSLPITADSKMRPPMEMSFEEYSQKMFYRKQRKKKQTCGGCVVQ